MPKRLAHILLQIALAISGIFTLGVFAITILNWKSWILLIELPYFLAFFGNQILGKRNNRTLPPYRCIITSLFLCALAWTLYLAIITNPFHLPFTPTTLLLPVFTLLLTATSYSTAAFAVTKNKNG